MSRVLSRHAASECARLPGLSIVALLLLTLVSVPAHADLSAARQLEPLARSAKDLNLRQFIDNDVLVDRIAAYAYDAGTSTWAEVNRPGFSGGPII